MIHKIIYVLMFLVISFSTCFADWKKDIDNGNYKLFSDVYPDKQNIYDFKSVTLNDKGEYVIEYKKEKYDKILKAYGGKNILIFDPKNNYKNKLNTKTEFKGNSVFITILKDKKVLKILNLDIDNMLSGMKEEGYTNSYNQIQYFTNNNTTVFLSCGRDYLSLYKFIKFIQDGEFEKINNFNNYCINISFINGYINFTGILRYSVGDINNNKIVSYLKNKYKKYFLGNDSFKFSINNKEKILNFLKDIYYYNYNDSLKDFLYNKPLKNLLINKDLIIKTGIFNSENFRLQIFYKDKFYSENDSNEISSLKYGPSNGKYIVNIDDNKSEKKVTNLNKEKYFYKSYFNIGEFIKDLKKQGYLNGININDIIFIEFTDTTIRLISNFPIQIFFNINNDILPITSKIKSPKNVSTNPWLISVNFLLALLYLLTFYLTTNLFNGYFEKLSSKSNWNQKISNFTKKALKFPLEKIYNYLIKISESKKIGKLKLYLNVIRNRLEKYEHKIYVILGFLLLGIIGQIIVDDFNVWSSRGWLTIFIMIIVLVFTALIKDILIYIFNKNKLKDNLKIENIPLGFVFAGIVAIVGKIVGFFPGAMFGSVIKLNTKNSIADRKTTSSNLLLKVLIIVFSIGIISWFLTIPFGIGTFIYKFLLIIYFGLINDVFFALLPFGVLWGFYILKNKKLKIRWFMFTFLVFFFLLHTIMNSEGDLPKLLEFDGNFALLVMILFFWIIVTLIMRYFVNKQKV